MCFFCCGTIWSDCSEAAKRTDTQLIPRYPEQIQCCRPSSSAMENKLPFSSASEMFQNSRRMSRRSAMKQSSIKDKGITSIHNEPRSSSLISFCRSTCKADFRYLLWSGGKLQASCTAWIWLQSTKEWPRDKRIYCRLYLILLFHPLNWILLFSVNTSISLARFHYS